MINFEKKFQEFQRSSYFSRIDNTHILELHIGLDDKGRKSIELRGLFDPKPIKSTNSIDVSQYKKEAYNTIRFSLKNSEVSGLFYKFCEDISEQSREIKDKKDGYQTITNRFNLWKKLFVSIKNDLLTESQIMGLIGELLFLSNELKEKIGAENALSSWSGQELTHKDFSYNDSWYEVKTISRGKQSVRISSLEQLESPSEGELIVYSLEKMSPAYNGLSLNSLILKIKDTFLSEDDKEKFLAAVALQGYEYNDYYDQYVYEKSSMTRYHVSQGFPKLTHESIPKEICKATYDILLDEIAPFVI